MVRLALPGGEAGSERGRPPGFGSGAGGSRWLRIPEFPPQLRRPGNVRPVSGAGAGPGGRKEQPIPRPQASGFSRPRNEPFPTLVSEGACGEGMEEGSIGKSKLHCMGWGKRSGPPCFDLEKGEGYPSPQFLSCEVEIEEDPFPPMSQPLRPGSPLESKSDR